MHKYLKRLVDERNSLAGLSQQITDRAAAEDRELTEPEAERMRDWQTRAAELDRSIAEQNEYLETQRSWARLQDKLTESADDAEARVPALAGAGTVTRAASWGETFTESAEFRAYNGRGSSGEVVVEFETRAPIDTTWSTVPSDTYLPTPWKMTTPLLDVISHERVSSGTVEWVEYPAQWPVAGQVAEGALKPEATFAPVVQTASLNTIAHWKGITRQALEDIPRVQSIVDNALRQGIIAKMEADTVVAVQGGTYTPVVNADLLAGIRIAVGNVQAAGYAQANAVLLNPADWATLDIANMGNTLNGPVSTGSFWGLRPVSATTIPVGTAYVGDFKAGVVQFERNSASVYMTDSHDDFFVRNILVLLAETRALSVVVQEAAINKVSTA